MTKKKSKVVPIKRKVKAVKILKIESPAPEEHVITTEIHVAAPIAKLPFVPEYLDRVAKPEETPALTPTFEPVEITPEHKTLWQKWCSLFD